MGIDGSSCGGGGGGGDVERRGREGKCQTREEGFGESQLKTTLQRSATFTDAAERARSYSVPQILTIKSL